MKQGGIVLVKQCRFLLTGILAVWLLSSASPGGLRQEGLLQPGLLPRAEASAARMTPLVVAAQEVGPAIVGISNKAKVKDQFNRDVLVEGVGSGVIFDARGYIVTNNHVVDNASELMVYFADGKTAKGILIGKDPATDLAVVKVDRTDLKVAQFGDSDSLMVAEPVIAIGNPLGLEFQGSVTAGVISALNRTLELEDRRYKLIQTDAAINPGNSGGALVNADGQVIGINSAKIADTDVQGLGFAIPINTVKPILQILIEKGKIERAFLGVNLVDQATAAANGYNLNIKQGIYIGGVIKGGPADKAGLKKGDILLAIDGKTLASIADLHEYLDDQPAGKSAVVTIERRGKTSGITVKLEAAPNS
ncbi:MAG: trypsin-like peptidase domain-containing protein [Negativicutes bacterium]|nr:trypsin-like peptidase domain-containing protein [Negativicutes bacterium]